MNFSRLSTNEMQAFLALHDINTTINSREEYISECTRLYQHLYNNRHNGQFKATRAVVDLAIAQQTILGGSEKYTIDYITEHYRTFANYFRLDLDNIYTPQSVIRILNYMDRLAFIDPLDFGKYNDEYDMMSRYFNGPELYLRAMNLIMYKYEYIKNDEERRTLDDELNGKQDLRTYLSDLTDVSDVEELVKRWYIHFNFVRYTESEQLNLIAKYIFAEEVMFNRMYRKYVDSNYDQYAPLSLFPSCERRH